MSDQNNQKIKGSFNSNNHQRRSFNQSDQRYHRNKQRPNNNERSNKNDGPYEQTHSAGTRDQNKHYQKQNWKHGHRKDFHRQQQQRPRGHFSQSGGSIDIILIQYDKLMDQYLDSRKKYFEMYGRLDRNKLFKLEDAYLENISRLKKFERELKPWQLEHLKKHKLNIYPQDSTFSEAHKDEIEEQRGNTVELEPIGLGVNFHLTVNQRDRQQYKDDTEQTSGTMEDYISYKATLKP